MPDAEITNVKQLRTFAKAVRDAGGKDMSRKLGKGLREVAKPALSDARSAAQAIPTTGRYNTGLRAAIARSLGIRASSGRVRIQVNPGRLPPGKQALPRLLEGPGSFRHPTPTGAFVEQQAHPWLLPTMRRHASQVRDGIHKVAQDILNDLEKKAT